MGKLEFEPVELEKVPVRGKYQKEVSQCVKNFLKSMDKGVKAMKSKPFDNRKEAMPYYDSFINYLKKEGRDDIQVSCKKDKTDGKFYLFLISRGSE